MKKVICSLFMLGIFSAFADDATTLTFQGKTNENELCSVVLSSARFHQDNVIALAKLGGSGIPFGLGNLTTKLKKFEMVYLTDSNNTLVSLQNEFDPAVHIKLKMEGAKVRIESYELILGGLSQKVITCD